MEVKDLTTVEKERWHQVATRVLRGPPQQHTRFGMWLTGEGVKCLAVLKKFHV